MADPLREIIADLRSYLEYLKGLGVESLPASTETMKAKDHRPSSRSSPLTLEGVRKEMGDCRRCKTEQDAPYPRLR